MKGNSKRKIIATRTASDSTSSTPIHRTRSRPRKKPRPSSLSLSPSPSLVAAPAPVKTRKSRQKHEPSQDDVFAIKDIIDEKLINGKRFFKIDWADHPTTGETFEPTWEPEENANENAIEDWERAKQLQALQAVPSDNSQVGQDQDQASDAPSEIESSRTKGICIALPSRADFLKSRPEFDTTSVIAISASQISDCPLPGSEIDLPPSQFFVVSSQPSQDIVVADSQPLLTGSSAIQQVGSKAFHAGISQTTIPDSQEILDGFTQEVVEVPGTAQELDQCQEETSPKPSNKDSSGSTIPSHQPNINQSDSFDSAQVKLFQETVSSMMDDSQGSAPKVRSVMDELRAIQAQFIPAASRGDADGTAYEETRAREELLTPVSPSDIVNSVEQDPADNIEQTSPQPPEAVASWGQEPGAGYFVDPSVPQHGSASAAESNMASLASNTPASAAVDQPAGLNVALTAAALGGEYESGLHAVVNDLATISPALLAGSGSSGVEDARLEGDLQLVPGTASSQTHNETNSGSDDFGILPYEGTAPNEYLIALHPPARSRPEMVSIINSHSREIESFDNYFVRGSVRSPDSKAAVKVTAMLEDLAELSNLPPYHKDLQDLSQEQWMKYARETSSKLAFIYELLNRLRECSMEVVILAAGGHLEKVEAIVSQCSFTYRHIQQQDWCKASTEQGSACKVVLVNTSLGDVQLRLTENIVVAYDESAESSGLLQLYKTKHLEDQCPMIFTLVEVFSLEHINRRLSPTMDPLEKSLAQIRCLILLLEYAEDRMTDGAPQPHDIAEELVRYMVEENTFSPPPTRWETWEHQQIPDEVFDTYKVLRSQLEPHREDRKRAREGSSDGTDTPKRPRIEMESYPADEAQVNEALKARFGANIRVKEDMAQVSVEQLEDLVTLVGDLEAALNKKGEEVNDYAKTVRKFQPKYKEAVGDRGKFQLERDNALKRVAYLEKQLQRSEAKLDQVKSEKRQLEEEYHEKIQTFSKSDDPEVAAAAKSQVSKDTLESTNKGLLQKLDSKEKQAEYANTSYREVSQQMASVSKENAELKRRIRDLETRADANVVEIRRMNDERMRDQLRMMYEQEKNMRLDREKEIERKNEEMRNYKARFGGRDTRGSSVPRSPRVRQISSRNTSPVGDNGGGAGGGVNGSNGGLGVGGTLFGPGRSHLRDL